MKIIYLDNASTTPVYDEVRKVMNECLKENYGNPSSPHSLGEKALELMNNARIKLAKEINCLPQEVIFTSGATESNNIAILGLTYAYPEKKKIIISSFEHSSVYEPAQELKKRGYEIVEIPVN